MAAAPPPTEVTRGTVVFTDIVGFTEYTALRGDQEAVALLSLQDSLVHGLLLWFTDACAALRTSLYLQQRFEEQSQEPARPLWVRMGMHSGSPTARGNDLVGHDVNVASRVMDVAGPGEVLLSEATLSEIGDRLPNVVFEELGPVVMKGIPAPMRLYRALPSV